MQSDCVEMMMSKLRPLPLIKLSGYEWLKHTSGVTFRTQTNKNNKSLCSLVTTTTVLSSPTEKDDKRVKIIGNPLCCRFQ